MHIHGVLAVEDKDKTDEIINISGTCLVSLEKNRNLRWQSYQGSPLLGVLGKVRKIMGRADCQGPIDLALLDLVHGHPFVKVQAVIAETVALPFASLLLKILKERERPMYFGAGGRILERRGAHLLKTKLEQVFLTDGGIHAAQRVFIGAGD